MPLTLEPPALEPPTIIESLDAGESIVSSVFVPAFAPEELPIITQYNGADEKVAVAIGMVIIGIWLLRYIMAFLPFFVGLGVIIAIFAMF